MPWFVVYKSETMNRETRSPPCPTQRSALTHARALDREGVEILRVEGPDGFVMPTRQLDAWLDGAPDILD